MKFAAASLLFALSLLTGCATNQALFVPIDGASYPARSEDFEIAVFESELPEQPYEKIAHLNVHMEKTHFVGSSYDAALEQLKSQARACGADAIINVSEDRSMLNETRILNLSAVAIRYTNS